MKKALVLLFAFSFPFLAGCSLLQTAEDSPLVAKLTVQQATLRVIDEDVERAERVLELAGQARSMVQVDEATVDFVDGFIRAQIDWGRLTLADAQLLIMLLDELRDRLAERMGEGLLSPEDRVSINRVIDWIEESASLVVLQMRAAA